MKQERAEVGVLLGQIDAGMSVLARMAEHLDMFLKQEGKAMGRNRIAGVVVADALSRYYTASETIFLRISRFFENSLDAERWHADLLDRMILAIPGFRPPVLQVTTHAALGELLRFRHFSRYYIELEYDWDRLDFLLAKYAVIKKSLPEELGVFRASLAQFATSSEGEAQP